MRVLMVSNLWPPTVVGGAEQYAAALAGRLRGLGHEVGVVTLGVPGPDVVRAVAPWPYPIQAAATQPALRRALFHIVDLHNPRARRALDRAIDEFAPDVVHSNVVQGLSTVALTRPSQRGVPHVHTLHDYWLLCQRNSMVRRDGRACDELCRSCAAMSRLRIGALRRHAPDVVLAVSRAIAAEHESLPWAAGRLRVLYNPVEAVPQERGAPPGAGSPLTFAFLGRVAPDKGVATLLAAFARADLGDARLVVAGRGPLEGVVRDAGGAVTYAGWLDATEKETLLGTADCVVVPSEWKDPAPVVVNEARARGIPVIGAQIGGIPELVAPECTPLLFPSGDVGVLADRLRTFAAAPARFRPEPAAASTDWPAHLEGVLTAYEDARRARRGPGLL